ncbi:MAG: hypothetical protein ACJ76I_05940 [Gaiellaceae bacterium]
MKKDLAEYAAELQDGDIVDVFFEFEDGSTSVERVDFGGFETEDGHTEITSFFPGGRPDLTCDSIPLDDVVDIKLVTPRARRPQADLETNTRGAGAKRE